MAGTFQADWRSEGFLDFPYRAKMAQVETQILHTTKSELNSKRINSATRSSSFSQNMLGKLGTTRYLAGSLWN